MIERSRIAFRIHDQLLDLGEVCWSASRYSGLLVTSGVLAYSVATAENRAASPTRLIHDGVAIRG